jgi:2-phosphosulfolactate phosphatase
VRIDVLFGVQQLTPQDVQGRVVAMIDVLRASTTIATALAHGAKAVIPFESSEEAVTRSKQLERGAFRLAGERRMLKMEGFDLGNSPLEHVGEAVEGKTVLLTTTNGTKALLAVQGARDVVVACSAPPCGAARTSRSSAPDRIASSRSRMRPAQAGTSTTSPGAWPTSTSTTPRWPLR